MPKNTATLLLLPAMLHVPTLLLIPFLHGGAGAQTPVPVVATAAPLPKTPLSQRLQALAKRGTITVAHRGDSGSHPENTQPAFQSALKSGAEMVELDFYQTKDGVLVCFHDGSLDRTTNSIALWKKKKAKIADFTLAELQELDAGAWKHARFQGTRIPTLESALRTIQKGSITMIEHKAGDPKVLVELLRGMKLIDDVLVQSFDWRFLRAVHRLEPRLTLAALGGSKSKPHPEADVLQEIRTTHSVMVHWNAARLRRQDVTRLRALGYLVCVYTVDDTTESDRLIGWGVHAITTNRPGELRAHLKSKQVRDRQKKRRL